MSNGRATRPRSPIKTDVRAAGSWFPGERGSRFCTRHRLEQAGAQTSLISLNEGYVLSFKHHTPAEKFPVDVVIDEANPDDFDAVVLPGGVINPDILRTVSKVTEFVRDIYHSNKPVAAICHGPWTLIDAGLVRGKEVTSWPSLRTDLTHAGARWVDQECVVDAGIITNRKPDDIPSFSARIIEALIIIDALRAKGTERRSPEDTLATGTHR